MVATPVPQAPAVWRFSDGTVAHLGGRIEGASAFARELRVELAHGDTLIPLDAHPGEAVRLDANDPAHVDRWLWREMIAPHRRSLALSLIERPEVPPLSPTRRGCEDEYEGAVY